MQNVFASRNKRTVPAPRNPNDKCTIVSIYPKLIKDKKTTIEPGLFVIQPGTYDKPSILVVGASSWWKELDEDQPLLEITNHSVQIAESLITDYFNGMMGCNMADAMPGVFYVHGELTVEEIKKKYSAKLAIAKAKQIKYWEALIRLANIGWARTNGNLAAISEDMRLAATELGITPDWMKTSVVMERCPACGMQRDMTFPICPHCGAKDAKRLSELGLVTS